MTVQTLVTALPDPDVLHARCRTLALLDSLLASDHPTHSFTVGRREGVDLACMEAAASLAHHTAAPEFRFEGFFDATVCVWRESGATAWQHGPVEFDADETDGSDRLFDLLTDGSAAA
ncbi:hypothetical protein ACSNOK_20755 [Streptomyces sp. URMC 126]|uniref:hypothetical protein n=1 Tax=Streptomyces sp. URMC 126 TaxID=3423401 RepID=UPI003F1AB69B